MKTTKLQSFSFGLILAANLYAAEDKNDLQPLDEDFLEFIANISEVDGEAVDSLDMLEIADNDMNTTTLLENDLNGEKNPDESTELKKLNSVPGEKKL